MDRFFWKKMNKFRRGLDDLEIEIKNCKDIEKLRRIALDLRQTLSNTLDNALKNRR